MVQGLRFWLGCSPLFPRVLHTGWGPLSRVIRALNWVIRTLSYVISPLTTVSIVRGPHPVGIIVRTVSIRGASQGFGYKC